MEWGKVPPKEFPPVNTVFRLVQLVRVSTKLRSLDSPPKENADCIFTKERYGKLFPLNENLPVKLLSDMSRVTSSERLDNEDGTCPLREVLEILIMLSCGRYRPRSWGR